MILSLLLIASVTCISELEAEKQLEYELKESIAQLGTNTSAFTAVKSEQGEQFFDHLWKGVKNVVKKMTSDDDHPKEPPKEEKKEEKKEEAPPPPPPTPPPPAEEKKDEKKEEEKPKDEKKETPKSESEPEQEAKPAEMKPMKGKPEEVAKPAPMIPMKIEPAAEPAKPAEMKPKPAPKSKPPKPAAKPSEDDKKAEEAAKKAKAEEEAAEAARLKAEQEAKAAAEAKAKAEAEAKAAKDAKAKAEAEAKAKAEQKALEEAEAKARAAAEAKSAAEAKLKAELAAKAAAEAKAKAEAEAKLKAEEEARAAAEAKAKAEAEAKAAAEAKARAEAEAKAAAAARALEEAEAEARRKAEEEARIAEEARKAEELAKQEAARKAAEERAAEEAAAAKARAEAEAKAAEEAAAAERARIAAEEAAAAAAAKAAAEAKAAEEARIAEEKAQRARELAAEKAKKEAEEAARKAAEEAAEKARKEAAEARKKAEEEERKRLEEEARQKKLEEEARKRREAAEKARIEAEEKRKAEELAAKIAKAAAEKARKDAEEAARKAAEEEKKLREEEARKAAAAAKAKAEAEAAEALAAQQLKEAGAFQIPGCSRTEFTERGDKSDYRGCQSRTLSGIQCQPWNTDKPHARGNQYKNMYNNKEEGLGDHNYCRSAKWGALWCYTSSSGKNWERCDPETEETYGKWPQPFHAPGCAASEEMHHANDYRGCQTKTREGYTCQNWGTDKPHNRGGQYKNYFNKGEEGIGDHNYCRSGRWGALWCYTNDPKKNWDRCDPLTKEDYPDIDAEAAKHNAEAAKLKAEAEAKLKAEAEAKAKAAQALKEAGAFQIPGCSRTEFTEKGDKSDYRGCQSRTKSGIQCQPWNTDKPHARGGQYKNMYEKGEEGLGDHNYCRSAKWGALWCYTSSTGKNWDTCDPETEETYGKYPQPFHAPGCAASEEMHHPNDYRGCQFKTKSGYTCQNWGTDKPHARGNQYKNYFNKGEEGIGDHNFCRSGRWGGLWCYTTDPKKNWERCDPLKKEDVPEGWDIPALLHNEKAAKLRAEAEAKAAHEAKVAAAFQIPGCSTTEYMEKNDASDYRGCQSRTRSGIQCQPWNTDKPHGRANQYKNMYKKGEEGLGDHNYCRSAKWGALWCYTSSSGKNWERCDPENEETYGKWPQPFHAPKCPASEEMHHPNDYRGCQTKTREGYTCQPWNTDKPHARGGQYKNYYNKGEEGIGDHNYCRSGRWGALWCYTDDPKKNWDRCDPLTADSFEKDDAAEKHNAEAAKAKAAAEKAAAEKKALEEKKRKEAEEAIRKAKAEAEAKRKKAEEEKRKRREAELAAKAAQKAAEEEARQRAEEERLKKIALEKAEKEAAEARARAEAKKAEARANAIKAAKSFSAPGCEYSEFTEKGDRSDYRGCQTRTRGGYRCQHWNSDEPNERRREHKQMYEKGEYGLGEHNYCRTARGGAGGLWCYTDNPLKTWDQCDPITEESFKAYPPAAHVPGCPSDEFGSGGLNDYRGCQNKTLQGYTCQNWASDEFNSRSRQAREFYDKKLHGWGDHNYCRAHRSGRLWCYTTDPKKQYDVCAPITKEELEVPFTAPGCSANERATGYQTDYRGCQSKTESGRTCMNWGHIAPHQPNRRIKELFKKGEMGIGDHNFCRNGDRSEKRIWCYTTDPRKRWEYCNPHTEEDYKPPKQPFKIPGCDKSEFASGREEDYRGCQSKTESGLTCQNWSQDSPHDKNRQSKDALKKGEKGIGDHNYCRNPDGEKRMWCYTTDPNKRWEYCKPAVEADLEKFQKAKDDAALKEAMKRNETAAQEEEAALARVKAFEAQIAALMAMLKQAQQAHAAADKKSDEAHDDLEKLLNDDAEADAKDEDAANDAENEAKKAEEQAEILKEEEKALEKAENDVKLKKAEKEAKKRKEEQEDDKLRGEQEAAEEAELAAKKSKENAEKKKEEEEAKKKSEEASQMESAKAQLEKEKAKALAEEKQHEEEIKAKKDEEEAKKALAEKKAEEKAEKDAENAEKAKKAAEKAKDEAKSKEAAEKAKTKEEKAAAALKLKEEEEAKLAAEEANKEAEAEALKKKEEEARQAAKKEEENKAAAMASEIAAKAAQASEAAKAGEELAKKKEEAAKKAAEERKKKRDERRRRRRNRRRNKNRKGKGRSGGKKGKKGKVAQQSSLPYFGQSNASSNSQKFANMVISPASYAITPSSMSPQAPQSISMVPKQQELHTVAVPLPLTSSGDKSEPQTVSISITLVEKDKKEDVKLIGAKKI